MHAFEYAFSFIVVVGSALRPKARSTTTLLLNQIIRPYQLIQLHYNSACNLFVVVLLFTQQALISTAFFHEILYSHGLTGIILSQFCCIKYQKIKLYYTGIVLLPSKCLACLKGTCMLSNFTTLKLDCVQSTSSCRASDIVLNSHHMTVRSVYRKNKKSFSKQEGLQDLHVCGGWRNA